MTKKTIRYVKQKDEYNCGPIAIVNVLKWAGLPLTYGSMHIFNHLMGTSIRKGTRRLEMSKTLKLFKQIINFRHKNEPSVEDIRNHLDKGGIAILLIRWIEDGESWGHYFVVDEVINGGIYSVINFTKSMPARSNITNYSLAEWLEKKVSGTGSKAWLIEKR